MAELAKRQARGAATTPEPLRGGVTYTPRVDIMEKEEELLLFADLPGVKPENLDVRFENQELILYGKVEPRHAQQEFLYGEYGIGDFYRTFAISEAIDSDKISAELNNGVLTVHLPKSEAVKPRRIQVKSG